MDVQNLKQLDTTARTWLSSAGFTREQGNALTTAVTRVVESTKGMNESQLRNRTRLWLRARQQIATGREDDCRTRRQATHPQAIVEDPGIGDSVLVVSALIDDARRWEIRNRR
jgi:hypothetical protein